MERRKLKDMMENRTEEKKKKKGIFHRFLIVISFFSDNVRGSSRSVQVRDPSPLLV
jgi:hypothetical protein